MFQCDRNRKIYIQILVIWLLLTVMLCICCFCLICMSVVFVWVGDWILNMYTCLLSVLILSQTKNLAGSNMLNIKLNSARGRIQAAVMAVFSCIRRPISGNCHRVKDKKWWYGFFTEWFRINSSRFFIIFSLCLSILQLNIQVEKDTPFLCVLYVCH